MKRRPIARATLAAVTASGLLAGCGAGPATSPIQIPGWETRGDQVGTGTFNHAYWITIVGSEIRINVYGAPLTRNEALVDVDTGEWGERLGFTPGQTRRVVPAALVVKEAGGQYGDGVCRDASDHMAVYTGVQGSFFTTPQFQYIAPADMPFRMTAANTLIAPRSFDRDLGLCPPIAAPSGPGK